MPNWVKVAERSDVVAGRGLAIEVEGRPIGLYSLDDRVHALADICPHAYALLSSGFVEAGEVECPLHFARFEIVTGRCTAGPAEDDVASIAVDVRGEAVFLDADAIAAVPM
jgi:nitrite reductase/ring-hydroxylating ferredoxin subunit